MQDAITLLQYFRGHLDCVLPAFGVTAASGTKNRILRILRTSKSKTDEDWVTRFDLSSGLRTVAPDDLSAALHKLRTVGIVEKGIQPTAAKPVERWRLAPEPNQNRRREDSEYSQQETTSGAENPNSSNSPNGVEQEIERVASILRTFTAEELAGFRREVAEATDDDPNAAVDREALARVDTAEAIAGAA
jgi:hypothetical protein